MHLTVHLKNSIYPAYIHTLHHTYTSYTYTTPIYNTYTDRRLLMTSYNLDTSDPLLLAEYLYHEMVAMGIRLGLGHYILVYSVSI